MSYLVTDNILWIITIYSNVCPHLSSSIFTDLKDLIECNSKDRNKPPEGLVQQSWYNMPARGATVDSATATSNRLIRIASQALISQNPIDFINLYLHLYFAL